MELSIGQIAIIIVTVLIARNLSQRKKKKKTEELDSLYPPKIREQRQKERNKLTQRADAQKKSPRKNSIASLYPPEPDSNPKNEAESTDSKQE